MSLTAERVREVLDYDPTTGVFMWKTRLGSERSIASWNTRHAGRRAGRVDNHGYVQIGVAGKLYRAHRLAWLYVYGEWPKLIDHVDRNRQNNQISNLREATLSQNHANSQPSKKNTSGVKGVTWFAERKKWRAYITIDRRKINLGLHETIEQAEAAVRAISSRHYGDFLADG